MKLIAYNDSLFFSHFVLILIYKQHLIKILLLSSIINKLRNKYYVYLCVRAL